MSAMVGFQVTDGMYIGYGYDLETTNLENYNSGSHEVFLRYEIFKNNEKIRRIQYLNATNDKFYLC